MFTVNWTDNPNRQERRFRLRMMRKSTQSKKTTGAFGKYYGNSRHPRYYLYDPTKIIFTKKEKGFEKYLKK